MFLFPVLAYNLWENKLLWKLTCGRDFGGGLLNGLKETVKSAFKNMRIQEAGVVQKY